MWTEGDIQREPHIGIKAGTNNSPHPSDSQIPDPELNKEEIKEMLKDLPSDKAAGPDGITNRILQASGEEAIDMIYLYMLIIWEVETYPGAWASSLM